MTEVLLNNERAFDIQGLNFHASISIKGENMRMDIIQFQRGKFYFFELNNTTIQKEVSNAWIFSNTVEIFDELISAKSLDINQEGCLMMSVPIQATSKNKLIKLNVSIPLKNVEFNGQGQKNKFYNEIAKIYKQMNNCEDILAFIKYPTNTISFNFIGDTANPHYRSFEVAKKGKQIKMLEENTWRNYSHSLSLPKVGKYYCRFKIVRYYNHNQSYNLYQSFFTTYNRSDRKNILIGICEKQIIGDENICAHFSYIGLNILNGDIYSKKTCKPYKEDNIFMSEENFSFKMEVDLDKHILTWYMNDMELCQEKIHEFFLKKEIVPVVSLYNQGDTVEFIY